MDADEDWTPEALRAMDDAPIVDDFIVKWVMPYVPPPARVLDAGCLIGKWFNIWKKHGYSIEGLDQCKVALDIARKKHPNIPLYFYRLQEMTFTKEFDLIYTIAVLQHNKHESKRKIIPRIWNALKSDGYFMIDENTFTKENYHYALGGGAPGYYPIPKDTVFSQYFTDGYSFTWIGWITFIESFGFKLIKSEPTLTLYLFKKVEKNA